MSSEVHPVSLELGNDRALNVKWSDGLAQSIGVRQLRDACGCASCAVKRESLTQDRQESALPVLSPAQTMPLEIVTMKPIGNYAYNIEFSDGHATGLFTLELLRSL